MVVARKLSSSAAFKLSSDNGPESKGPRREPAAGKGCAGAAAYGTNAAS